jgi:nucleotide-binding universal stress UspA family protein
MHVMPPADVPHRYRPGDVQAAWISMTVRLAREARECAEIFSAEAKRAGATSMWSDAAGDVAQEICHRARYTDLVVVGQYERQEPVERHPLPIANAVVLRCGRPVLVVPEDASSISLEKVVIAWDGSREAVRSVNDALPLLALSHLVRILKIVPPSGPAEPADSDDLVAHLVRHGVRVEPDSLGMKTAAEHAHLRDQIGQGGYDLAVMGAYSHPPWFEFVFGGATQSILSSSVVPVLVSH